MVVTHDRQERQPITAPTRNWRFSASYDSFVIKQTLVLRINIYGENPPLRQAANRSTKLTFAQASFYKVNLRQGYVQRS